MGVWPAATAIDSKSPQRHLQRTRGNGTKEEVGSGAETLSSKRAWGCYPPPHSPNPWRP